MDRAQAIALHYGQLIGDGQLQPGDLLPTRAVIADQHGCSYEVAGEALRLLRKAGLAHHVQGSDDSRLRSCVGRGHG